MNMTNNDIIERGFACLYENLGFIDTERFIAYVLTDEGYAEFMRRCAKLKQGVDTTDSVCHGTRKMRILCPAEKTLSRI